MTIFQTMTDEQLALWHRMQTCIDRLTHELDDATAAAAAAQVAADEKLRTAEIELATRGNIILDLTMKHGDQLSANRRLCGQQVILAKALRALVDAVGNIEATPEAANTFPDVVRPFCEAVEVLTLIEIPF